MRDYSRFLTVVGSGGLVKSMKITLFALFAVILMDGCVRERKTEYYDNGQKKYEATWKEPLFKKKNEPHSKLDGPFTKWRENGQKSYQKNYKDGKKHGPFIVYNTKGEEVRRDNYKDGKLVED